MSTANWNTPGPARHERTVVLPQGMSAFDIADRLEEAGVIDDPLLFVAGLWIEDRQHSLKAGEYMFEALVTPRRRDGKAGRRRHRPAPVYRHGGQ